MSTGTYIAFGIIAIAAGVWIKSADPDKTPKMYAMVHGNEQSVQSPDGVGDNVDTEDNSLMWTCSRSNSNGSGTVPCILILEPNRVTFSYTDSAQVTFHTQDKEGSTAEVSGVQVEGGNRQPAFGFCEFRGDGVRCEASSGSEMVEYEAR